MVPVGLVYQPALGAWVARAGLEVVEIEPQTTWIEKDPRDHAGPPALVQEQLGSCERVAAHSVTIPVGTHRSLPRAEREALARDVEALDAIHVSEHLSFRRMEDEDGHWDAGFLLPPLQTPETVGHAAERLRELAASTRRPVAFETPTSYLRPQPWEMPDGEFAAAVAEEAGCGILLDVHNIWANAENGRQNPGDYLASIPLDRVIEIHLAGGQRRQGYWLDGHDGPSPDAVLQLAAAVQPHCPRLQAVFFEIMPRPAEQLGEAALRAELDRIRTALSQPQGLPRPTKQNRSSECSPPTTAEWERALGRLVVGAPDAGGLREDLATDPGISLLRELVWHARAGQLARVLPRTIRHLHEDQGPSGARRIVTAFFATERPALDRVGPAERFARWLCAETSREAADLAARELRGLRAHPRQIEGPASERCARASPR